MAILAENENAHLTYNLKGDERFMKKLLLTGFKPFLNNHINPTEKIVETLNGKEINGYTIVGKILPVDFKKSGVELLKYIDEIKPDAVISLGLANGRSKITPERIAINCNDGPKDNSGYKPDGEVIIEDGDDGLFTTLPIKKMVRELNEAYLPASISNTAGTYLCNNVMYHSLDYFKKKNQQVPSGFIHIPASHELAVEHRNMPSWSHEDLTKAIKICIECL